MSPSPSARLAELRGLIVSLFSAEEFRRWLAQHASECEILAELPGDAATLAVLVDKALLALERRGVLGPLFFARLQEARGGRSEEIERIAALWSRSESGRSAELAGSTGASETHAHGAGVTMWAGRWGEFHVRLWRWCIGHPSMGSAAAALLFVSLATLGALAVIDEQRSAKQAQVRQVNAHHAEMIAGTVLLEIEAFRDAVARVASDQSLVAAIEGDDYERVQAICEASYLQHERAANGEELTHNSPFDLWFVLDAKGVLRAQFGRAGRAGTLNREYRWRDYFVGAEKLGPKAQATYVSRAFRSEGDGYHKFAISAPLRGEEGRLVGVLVAGIASDASLGSVAMDDEQSVAVLVAPRDRERHRDPRRQFPYLIIRHPAFDYGDSIGMASEQIRQLDERRREGVARFWPRPVGRVDPISGYNDPVGAIDEEYTGSWSAGFAAVGQTGLVIIVQSRDEEVMKTEQDLAWQIALSTTGAAVPGLMIVGLTACRRRGRVADEQPRS